MRTVPISPGLGTTTSRRNCVPAETETLERRELFSRSTGVITRFAGGWSSFTVKGISIREESSSAAVLGIAEIVGASF